MHVNLPEKRYYSIGEIAKAFNVNTSLLRFWEKEFREIQPKKKQGGARKYTPEDVTTIQKIYHLLKITKKIQVGTKMVPIQEMLSAMY